MKLWSWGANTNGQLGHGYASEQISRPLHVQCDLLVDLLNNVSKNEEEEGKCNCKVKIQGGGTQTLICGTAGSKSVLLKIGAKALSKTSGNSTNSSSMFEPKIVPTDFIITEIACGWDFDIILSSDGSVYSCGDNKYGQLGQESLNESPQKIPSFSAQKISAGLRHAAAIGTDGQLYQWGDNSRNQLGSSSSKILTAPSLISGQGSPKFVDVKCGKGWTLCLSESGEFWGCGVNKFGQLGPGDALLSGLKKLDHVLPTRITQYCCGWNHVLALGENGKLISWGRNNFSQLGRNTLQDFDTFPKAVEDIPESIVSIACGSEHNLALGNSGRVYAWGWNEHENCGVKSSRVSFCESSGVKLCEDCVVRPVVVDFPDRVVSIACGAGNGFAISV